MIQKVLQPLLTRKAQAGLFLAILPYNAIKSHGRMSN